MIICDILIINMKKLINASILFLFYFLSTSCGSTKVATSNLKENKKSGSTREKVIATAKSYIGTHYKVGGTDHNGIDCSGLALKSYESIGKKLPRTAHEQADNGKRIYIAEFKPGDLIFFNEKKGSNKITHVGIIHTVSKEKVTFIHASTSHGVREDEMTSGYWKDHYVKACNLID